MVKERWGSERLNTNFKGVVGLYGLEMVMKVHGFYKEVSYLSLMGSSSRTPTARIPNAHCWISALSLLFGLNQVLKERFSQLLWGRVFFQRKRN
jgi:hypothetical protein